MPQVCTSLGEDAVRRQLDGLAAGRLEMDAAVKASRAARAPLSPDQIVAIREPCPAADPRDSDVAVARSVLESPGFNAALFGLMPEER